MSNQNNKCFSLQSLADEVVTRPAPESCEEIARLLSDLPLWSSFINKTPKPEQKRAYEFNYCCSRNGKNCHYHRTVALLYERGVKA